MFKMPTKYSNLSVSLMSLATAALHASASPRSGSTRYLSQTSLPITVSFIATCNLWVSSIFLQSLHLLYTLPYGILFFVFGPLSAGRKNWTAFPHLTPGCPKVETHSKSILLSLKNLSCPSVYLVVPCSRRRAAESCGDRAFRERNEKKGSAATSRGKATTF